MFLFISNVNKNFLTPSYKDGDWLVFGRESKGLEPEILELFDNHLSIPSTAKVRSFNIANAVSFAIGGSFKTD